MQARQQQWPHVVTVTATTGHRLAIQRNGYSASRVSGASAAHWRRPAPRHSTLPNRPCRNRTGCPCRSRLRNRNPGPGLRAAYQRSPGGVAGCVQWQRDSTATDRIDPHRRLVDAAHAHGIADTGNGMAENVEAHCHVGQARTHVRSQPRSFTGGDPQQVREHTRCRHLRTRTRTLHHQRVVAVATGTELHHVVGQPKVGEGVSAGSSCRPTEAPSAPSCAT